MMELARKSVNIGTPRSAAAHTASPVVGDLSSPTSANSRLGSTHSFANRHTDLEENAEGEASLAELISLCPLDPEPPSTCGPINEIDWTQVKFTGVLKNRWIRPASHRDFRRYLGLAYQEEQFDFATVANWYQAMIWAQRDSINPQTDEVKRIGKLIYGAFVQDSAPQEVNISAQQKRLFEQAVTDLGTGCEGENEESIAVHKKQLQILNECVANMVSQVEKMLVREFSQWSADILNNIPKDERKQREFIGAGLCVVGLVFALTLALAAPEVHPGYRAFAVLPFLGGTSYIASGLCGI